MKLRERLLQHLRHPQYRPQNEREIAQALGLAKKERKSLTHEVRLLTARGLATRTQGDRIALAGEEATITGRISFRASGAALVMPEAAINAAGPPPAPVYIPAEDTDVAWHGDRVAVRLSPTPWQAPARGTGRGGAALPSGRVTRVLARARETVVGTLRRARHDYYVTPDDPRLFRDIAVPAPSSEGAKPGAAVGDKVVVRLAEWKHRLQAPTGEIVERLGKTFEPRAELAGVYRKFDLDPTFPPAVEREAAALPGRVSPRDLAGRLDYRDIPTVTIDPDDAKDFDDALSLEPLKGGGVRVGIHIADVSAYVRTGSALDREAQRRGNSTYLVGTVVPMLPEKLSNGLCSLVEGEDRLTKAVRLSFDAKGRLREVDFAETVIRSRKRLTYRQAYALLFENDLGAIRALPLPPKHQTGSTGRALSSLSDAELVDLQSWIRRLWKIARKLRADRFAAGSLDLDMPETKIFVDEQGYADRLERVEHDESHQLIEEFMLAANEAVARATREHRLASLYRVHDDPDEEKLGELRNYLATFGVVCGDLGRREEVVRLTASLQKHPQGYLLRTQLLRSLKKAVYRATPDGHYGLAKKDYTHFTSPIRRYADLVVHRVLAHYLAKHTDAARRGRPAPGYNATSAESLGEHLSLTEQNSTEAERESQKIKLLEFFERELAKPQRTAFAAMVTEVRGAGLFIELTDSMTFGFLPFAGLPAPSPQRHGRRVARGGAPGFAVGDSLLVEVDRVDRFKRQIDFRLASEPAKKTPGRSRARVS